jgi:hypothetical protein
MVQVDIKNTYSPFFSQHTILTYHLTENVYDRSIKRWFHREQWYLR